MHCLQELNFFPSEFSEHFKCFFSKGKEFEDSFQPTHRLHFGVQFLLPNERAVLRNHSASRYRIKNYFHGTSLLQGPLDVYWVPEKLLKF